VSDGAEQGPINAIQDGRRHGFDACGSWQIRKHADLPDQSGGIEGCKRNRPIGGLHKGAHRPGFQIISGIARLTLSEKNVSRLKADWRERPQDLLEGVAEQVVGRDRICRESLILQSARRFTYSRKPAFDLSDIVRRSGTVITGARPVSARPLDCSAAPRALGRAEGASLTAKA